MCILVIVYSLNIITLYSPVNMCNVMLLDNQLYLQAYW